METSFRLVKFASRFTQMCGRKAAVMARRGKCSVFAAVLLLLSCLGQYSCQQQSDLTEIPEGLEASFYAAMDSLPRLSQPISFTLSFRVAEECESEEIYIYQSDDYFRFNGNHPIDTIPVVNSRAKYKVVLDRMVGGAWCTKSDPSHVYQLFFVPGESVITVLKPGEVKPSYSTHYEDKIALATDLVRKVTCWHSPHMPQVQGDRWFRPESESRLKCWNPKNNKTESAAHIRDIYFTDTATIVHVASSFAYYPHQFFVPGQTYLRDVRTDSIYRFIKPLNREANIDSRVFGCYGEFEPLPLDSTYELELVSPSNVITVQGVRSAEGPADPQYVQEDEDAYDYEIIGKDSLLFFYRKDANDLVSHQNQAPKLEFVQMWKGGPKFATTNLGAHRPKQYGTRFSWVMANRVVEQIGHGLRLPSREDMQGLVDHCNVKWVDRTSTEHAGIEVRGRGEFAKNVLFFAAGGDSEGSMYKTGQHCLYWTSTLAKEDHYVKHGACFFSAGVNGASAGGSMDQEMGLLVRLVTD